MWPVLCVPLLWFTYITLLCEHLIACKRININPVLGDHFMSHNKVILRYKHFLFPGTQPVLRSSKLYGEGIGEVVLRDLDCTGSESNLLECSRLERPFRSNDCSHSEDAGVRCGGKLLAPAVASCQSMLSPVFC